MCKEGWSIELGQEGVAWGEDAWNTLKRGGAEKREGKQRFLKGATSWVKRLEVGALKGETGTPLETMTHKNFHI